jgi:hypothetical protein
MRTDRETGVTAAAVGSLPIDARCHYRRISRTREIAAVRGVSYDGASKTADRPPHLACGQGTSIGQRSGD